MSTAPPSPALRVGISECLLGQAVRYDGRHKGQPWVAELEAAGVTWWPLCPEVQAGLGVPRPPMALVQVGASLRLQVCPERAGGVFGPDHTEALDALIARCLPVLARLDLDGYILKSRSPSCGLGGVPIHDAGGRIVAWDAGRFAAALRAALPTLWVVEEGSLADPAARSVFLERLRTAARARRGEP